MKLTAVRTSDRMEGTNGTVTWASRRPLSAVIEVRRSPVWKAARRCVLAAIASMLLGAGFADAQNLSFGSQTARPAPEWLQSATIYELWLDAFTPEANLRGAIARLPKVAELGAKIVYLSPIAKFTARPHGSPYNVADYNGIDPEVGTAQDLHDFVKAAHDLHLKVMLDIVYYHAAPDNVLVKEHPEYFVKTTDGRMARGFWPQPLPDYNNPEMRKYLIASLVHWVRDFDVDGFRCDVGAGVPISFWNEARKALDATKRDVVLLSESDRPDDQLQAFDINYNFDYYLTLVSVLRDGAPAIKIREQWEKMHAAMP
ncbi:MAG TPA: alpha-amylase family glycosyl hydrolase, partial [Terracidiphilus sp.]|nr:alpha-amylase family glycosyl hydrolase [Terracidiphilus sp.]